MDEKKMREMVIEVANYLEENLAERPLDDVPDERRHR